MTHGFWIPVANSDIKEQLMTRGSWTLRVPMTCALK